MEARTDNGQICVELIVAAIFLVGLLALFFTFTQTQLGQQKQIGFNEVIQ